MKKTFKLILVAMLALFVFASCENKASEETKVKTAKDYLAGRTIITSLEYTYVDEEPGEEDYEDELAYYKAFPVYFDKDSKLTSPTSKITDFEGDVDGMVYKTTFKQTYPKWDEESGDYVDGYIPYTIDFKVVNESKVIISGSMVDEYGQAIQFKATEATISGDLPSWFTSSDWVYIPTEELEYAPLEFTIISETSWLSDIYLGEEFPYVISSSISSKNNAVQISSEMKLESSIMNVSMNSNIDISKVSDEEAKLYGKQIQSVVDVENKVEEGNFISYTASLKRIDSNPDWLDSFHTLEAEEDYVSIPVSNVAYNSYFGWTTVVYDFDRVVDEDTVTITLFYGVDNDDDYREFREVYVINKLSNGKFSCTLNMFEIDSEGNETLTDSYESDNFVGSEEFAILM